MPLWLSLASSLCLYFFLLCQIAETTATSTAAPAITHGMAFVRIGVSGSDGVASAVVCGAYAVGAAVGSAVGASVGSAVGSAVGTALGSAAGSAVGTALGSAVGSAVDTGVAAADCCVLLGAFVGCCVAVCGRCVGVGTEVTAPGVAVGFGSYPGSVGGRTVSESASVASPIRHSAISSSMICILFFMLRSRERRDKARLSSPVRFSRPSVEAPG